ncbi:MAG: transaldolase [Anaerolineae bacterium]|nr:transaldolase [Caldilineales bacterium]MCX7853894.1 transaldolase [Caldilineales bacterium]MDW8268492.1 transaldolase [Anaerolineae bacterium]
MNTAQQLYQAGQSLWYDNIERRLLNNGQLAGMIARGEIRGVTSNPTIFANAITRSNDYAAELEALAKAGKTAEEIFWDLAIEDIRAAADLLLPLYEQTDRGDGYVSLEVNPYLANDTRATLVEAKRLWQRVNRPNLMVKIPATLEGLPAIMHAIEAGINVNVTLIFSRERYWAVMEMYISGLERRVAAGLPVDAIASVASFFVSRVDTKVDAHLMGMIDRGGARAEKAAQSLGQAAVANARLAYHDFKIIFGSPRFAALKAQGARVQRPLWASTGTKNPAYRDVLYVEELVGKDTVNTVPPATLAAFLDHGVVRANSLEEDLPGAYQALARLEALGISMTSVTTELEAEGVKSFANSWKALMDAVELSRQAVIGK